MGDLRSRIAPLFRRSSTTSAKSSISSASNTGNSRSRTSLLTAKNRKSSLGGTIVYEEAEIPSPDPSTPSKEEAPVARGRSEHTPDTSLETLRLSPLEKLSNPIVAIEAPTPDLLSSTTVTEIVENPLDVAEAPNPHKTSSLKPAPQRPEIVIRRQSLAHSSQAKFLETLLEPEKPQAGGVESAYHGRPAAISANMLHRKIWVKRLGASATLVSISEEDLVDDVRDRILKKYANSLGRNFDAPDVTLRIVPRDHSHRHSLGERTLGPEEPIARTLDGYFPGGQSVDEALIIDVPRRTPRHSPRPVPSYYMEDNRPVETGTDYFPVIPAGQHSPHLPSGASVTSAHASAHHLPLHSMSVLNTGQVPPLPSPGAARGPRHGHRPKYNRTQTTSPTIKSNSSGPQGHGRL